VTTFEDPDPYAGQDIPPPEEPPADPWEVTFQGIVQAEEAIAAETPTMAELEAQLWDARPMLRHLHTCARARGSAPLAVLGATLARLVATVPPQYVLPGTIGGHGSLNLFVAMVGPSGGGKGTAHAVAAHAIDLSQWRDPISGQPLRKAGIGSGEGLVRQYVLRDKSGEIKQLIASLLMDVPEVDTLTALSARQGATLTQKLREVYSGEDLDFSSYADQAKALRVAAHSYRASLILGVQPRRAGPLLAEADGGLPQRFLWVPVVDPTMPPPGEWPEAPEPVPGTFVGMPYQPGQRKEIGLHKTVTDDVRMAHYRRSRGDDGEELDGHRMQTRVKVAAALAVLDGHLSTEGVTADDWKLSSVLMAISDLTRDAVRTEMVTQAQRANVAKGRAAGEQEIAKANVQERALVAETSQKVLDKLAKLHGAWMSQSDLRRSLTSGCRQVLPVVFEKLEETGAIESETGEYRGQQVVRYRLRRGNYD
jgi:hypothetical protein